ncbi:vasodilator-stimulated phosphoprotein-like [Leucoraja erinacea]|uniref:vasodilator-stimulated phosphoprotein-like n=1 Tax=Leucoraja erinaceus TaxID=7782 RepID=UPI002453CAAB|nr:vasodilator-stimulated phosphoprotein-like [Leucoraja erinacea]
MSETSICQARATVMIYDDANKKWVPAGTGTQVFSRVHIYHNPGSNTFRVVGRKIQQDQQVVINCPIAKGLKYNQATPSFHQWRDMRQVWGLNFGSKEDAMLFANGMQHALEVLEGTASAGNATMRAVNNGPTAEELEQQRRQQLEQQQKQEQLEREQQERRNAAAAPPAPTPHLPVHSRLFLLPPCRRKVTDKPAPKKEDEPSQDANSATKTSTLSSSESMKKPWERNSSTLSRGSSSMKNPESPTSPSNVFQPRVKAPQSANELSSDDSEVDRMKQELLEEVKKELQKVKDEIIEAVREEMRRLTS